MQRFENTNKLSSELIAQLRQHVYDIIGCCQEVHRELGPWLNEYVYQEALQVALTERQIPHDREHYFRIFFHSQQLEHKHYIDFLCKDDVALECKAITAIGIEQRQQLWNYMRLTSTPVGVLYNFAPSKDQCEKYYLNTDTKTISAF